MNHKLVGGILLVSGTTIGAGMLALPVSTGMAGFFPTVVLFFAYWIFMTFTALLFLEITLSTKEDVNMITMAKNTLGKPGMIVNWIVYLFLLYALTTAYIAGSAPIFIEAFYAATGISLPEWAGTIPLLLIFGFFVYEGAKAVDYANRILMIGLIVTYCWLTFGLIDDADPKKLLHVNWSLITAGVSIVATSFGFHIIIPTLSRYLKRDIPLMKKVLLIGSFIPLVIYIIWEFFSLGILPLEGPHGIIEGYRNGDNAADLIARVLNSSWLAIVARAFAFFAIVTSFLGVSISLRDFLADGLKIKKSPTGKIFLYLATFVPPLLITLLDPRAFLSALEYAGAFGVVTLLGFMPAIMVWRGRYHHQYESEYTAPGGKLALILAMGFSILIIAIEIGNKMGFFPVR